MPWKPPATEKCPKCNKSVYANESRLAAGVKWHIMCFKCTKCNKLLESTTVTEHEGELFCKGCHGKNFGPKGYGYGQGAGVLSMEGGADDKVKRGVSAPGPGVRVEGGCPRCGRQVYQAEKQLGAGGNWHKSCFNCAECHKALDSMNVSDKEGEIYCKGCYGKLFGPKGVGYGLGAGTLST